MATVTPNFNWSVPTSTDLVKDGATAIETLGDSIDASFVGLKGGTTGQVLSKTSGTDLAFTWIEQDDSNAIQNGIVDAKGDLISATAADTPARLAVGTDGQVLTADSTAGTGIKWATPVSGSLTLLSTTALSTTTTTISSISQSYTNLMILGRDLDTVSGNNAALLVRLNGISTSSYFNVGVDFNSSAAAAYSGNGVTYIPGIAANIGGTPTGFNMNIFRYTDTARIMGEFDWNFDQSNGTTRMGMSSFRFNAAAAITSITFTNSNSESMTGTIYIYGVN